ncbi:VPS4-associated protein 1 [Papiliotrema laurentii]|uniref:VPS4-associated protein 1 n=1 Tax=Papiliotrema laurentii TaxID=5418 RepID=A0AAD9FQY9_PAPLA|nr:VPS4-associated protein 1 [Papiliotrema laurentii]
MSAFQNVYYERKVATPRPCYICKRPTPTVLSTIKTEDFLYTCDSHLLDPGFATLIPPTQTGPSAEDIQKVIADYHVREARKAEAAKGKNDEGKEEKNDAKDTKDPKKASDKGDTNPASPSAAPTSPALATHRKFALHRQIFEMRQHEIRKKEQGVKAREVGKGLPQVPRGMF